MTRQEWRGIPALARRIRREREQLLYLRERATSVASTTYDRDRVQNTVENRAGVYTDMAVDLEREIAELEAELTELQERAAEEIEGVIDPLARRILTQRYVHLSSWETIADLTGYTVRRVHQIESASLSRYS